MRMNPAAEDLLARIIPPEARALPAVERDKYIIIYDEMGQPIPPHQAPMVRVIRGEQLAAIDIHLNATSGDGMFLSMSGAPLRDSHGDITGAVIVLHDVTERRQLERRTRAALEAVVTLAHALVMPDTFARDPAKALLELIQRLITITQHVLGCERVVISVSVGHDQHIVNVAVGLRANQATEWWESLGDKRIGEDLPPAYLEQLTAGEPVLIDMSTPPFLDRPNPYGARVVAVAPMRLDGELGGTISFDYGGDDHHFTTNELALAAAVAHLVAMVIERERLIHEREAARAEALALAEANRRMDAFLNLAGHEMRTPLTHFKGGVQLALRRLERLVSSARADGQPIAPDQLQPIQEVLAQTDQQTSRMKRLVQDVIDVAALQFDAFTIAPVPCDLVAILQRTVAAQRVIQSGRVITLAIPDTCVMVEADAIRIEQVIVNYLTNACKFSPLACPVTVALTHTEAEARVSVRDAGPGVPPDWQQQIWERGYRVAGTEVTSGSDIGLGLGLYLARNLIERHHGQVGLHSVVGCGATFWFSLPTISATPG
jgi:signal transduction histidine kinase